MALKKTAREYLIDAVKTLMQNKTIENITVDEILDISGVSRTTFYKNFQDKQDLVSQVFIGEITSMYFYDIERPLYEREIDILKHIDENRAFYQNAVKSDEFLKTWMEKAMDADEYYIRAALADFEAPDRIFHIYAYLMSQTFAQSTIDWAKKPCGFTAEEYARILVGYLWHGLSGFEDDYLHTSPEVI